MPCAWLGNLPHAEKALHKAGHNTSVGDEGGFRARTCARPRSARFHHVGDRKGRLHAGEDVRLALDCAASEFYKDGKYDWKARASR
jgi:enolase